MEKKGAGHGMPARTAYDFYRSFPRSLAKDLQDFLILSPAHDLSANHLQVTVHMVKVVGILRKRLQVWATATDTRYHSVRIKLLELSVSKKDVLHIDKGYESNDFMLTARSHRELRDEICLHVLDVLQDPNFGKLIR